MAKKNLYPVNYNGELWDEDDCDEMFIALYHSKEALREDGCVYLGEGIWVGPDGSTGD